MAETRYRYVSLDSDHDISASELELTIDGTTWVTAEPVDEADLPPTVVGLKAPETGRTRYWWRILTGPGQTLVPTSTGQLRLRGRLTDTPEILEPRWVFYD